MYCHVRPAFCRAFCSVRVFFHNTISGLLSTGRPSETVVDAPSFRVLRAVQEALVVAARRCFLRHDSTSSGKRVDFPSWKRLDAANFGCVWAEGCSVGFGHSWFAFELRHGVRQRQQRVLGHGGIFSGRFVVCGFLDLHSCVFLRAGSDNNLWAFNVSSKSLRWAWWTGGGNDTAINSWGVYGTLRVAVWRKFVACCCSDLHSSTLVVQGALTTPGARAHHAMIYDRTNKQLVLFGGKGFGRKRVWLRCPFNFCVCVLGPL